MTVANSTPPQFLKRFRMEVDLRQVTLADPELPDGYTWRSWDVQYLLDHALAKFESFRDERDCQIFPALRSLAGCRELMQSIAAYRGFLPETTWLIELQTQGFRPSMPCGTIQGLRQSSELGAIQNVGVIPEHRSFGLGRALLLKNLHGFRAMGLSRVYLDVTAENLPAISLYRSIGFQHVKTSYREIVQLPDEANSPHATK